MSRVDEEKTDSYPPEYGESIRRQLDEISRHTASEHGSAKTLRRVLELLEEQSARHSTLENALLEQTKVIEEVRDRSANLHLRGSVTDSRHDLEIVGLENKLRVLSEAVLELVDVGRTRGDAAVREQKSTRWVVYMLIPVFTALVEAIRVVFHTH